MIRQETYSDRRSESRLACNLTCSVRRLAEPGGLAHAVDISPEGMRLHYVGGTISPTEKVLVQFTLQRRTYSFCGTPLRIGAPDPFAQEVALRFQAVDPRTRKVLRRHLAEELSG